MSALDAQFEPGQLHVDPDGDIENRILQLIFSICCTAPYGVGTEALIDKSKYE